MILPVSAFAEETVSEMVEENDADVSERAATTAVEGYEDLEDVEIIDYNEAHISQGSNARDHQTRQPAFIERIIRIDGAKKHEVELQAANPTSESATNGDSRAARPELGSTANKTRKVIHCNTPVLKKKRDKNSLIPNAASLSERHIEPMIEGHQVLNPEQDKSAQELLLKVTVN